MRRASRNRRSGPGFRVVSVRTSPLLSGLPCCGGWGGGGWWAGVVSGNRAALRCPGLRPVAGAPDRRPGGGSTPACGVGRCASLSAPSSVVCSARVLVTARAQVCLYPSCGRAGCPVRPRRCAPTAPAQFCQCDLDGLSTLCGRRSIFRTQPTSDRSTARARVETRGARPAPWRVCHVSGPDGSDLPLGCLGGRGAAGPQSVRGLPASDRAGGLRGVSVTGSRW